MKSIKIFLGLFWVLFIVLLIETLTAQTKPTQAQQIQQLQNEIAKRDVIIADTKAERNGLILQLATLNAKIVAVNKGIDKATIELQKGYDSGKLNYKEIWDCGFRISIDSTNVYQRPTKDKDKGK